MISAATCEMFSFYWRVVVRPYWGFALLIGALMAISACLDMMTIGVAVPLLDILTQPARVEESILAQWLMKWLLPAGVAGEQKVLLFALLALACVLFLIRSGFYLMHRVITLLVAQWFRRRLKVELFEHFLRAPLETVTQWARGVIVQRIDDPSEAVNTTIGHLGSLVSSLLNCVVMVALMMVLSWRATLCVGLLVMVGIQGWRSLSQRRAEIHGRTLFELRGEENKIEVDAIDGIKVVKAHGLESTMVELQRGLLLGEVRPASRIELFSQVPTFVNEVIASAIMLMLGAMTFLMPDLGIRFSTLVAFLLAIRRIAPAVSLVNSSFVSLGALRRTLEVVEEVLVRMPQERGAGETIGRAEEIRFRDVSFSYASRPERRALEEVSFHLPRGTVTALVGPTGAGKSTVVNLLMGFCQPQEGLIEMNGIPLTRLGLTGWRRSVGYVSQDVFVFNTTIRENIALWEGIPDREIEWAAQVSQLHDFIVSLPQGYNTVVGDRGLRLSGGQCQRLSIAQAILRRPQVLIFDEATSALDNLTERAVYEAIEALHGDSIVLVVAHRLSTIREADRILVLQDGRIVEAGTHETLMEEKGVYSRLYQEGQEQTQLQEGVADRVQS